MTTVQTYTAGEMVFVTYLGKTVPANVMMASENGKSLMLKFETMLGGYLGMMPILLHDGEGEDGEYHDLIMGLVVTVTPFPS